MHTVAENGGEWYTIPGFFSKNKENRKGKCGSGRSRVRNMSNKVAGKRQKGVDSPELREKDARSMAGIMGVFSVAVLGIFPLAYDN